MKTPRSLAFSREGVGGPCGNPLVTPAGPRSPVLGALSGSSHFILQTILWGIAPIAAAVSQVVKMRLRDFGCLVHSQQWWVQHVDLGILLWTFDFSCPFRVVEIQLTLPPLPHPLHPPTPICEDIWKPFSLFLILETLLS